MNLTNPLTLIWLLILLLITCYAFFYICCFYYFFITNFFNFNNNNCYKELNIKEIKAQAGMYVHLSFISDYESRCDCHPLTNYYFITDDLSLNLNFKLKWLRYSVEAFKYIKNCLTCEEYIEDILKFESNFKDANSIQNIDILKNLQNQQHIITLFINNKIIIIDDDFNIDILIEELNAINMKIFDNCNSDTINSELYMISEDDMVDIKLNLNLIEYIALTSNKCSITFASVLYGE